MSFDPLLTHDDVRLRFGEGSLDLLPELLTDLKARRILFVVDSQAYNTCGERLSIEKSLAGFDVTHFSQFALNPQIDDVYRGIAAAGSKFPDAIVALGGGSAIDMAKLIGLCGSQSCNPRDLVQGLSSPAGSSPPIVAIPTTAGTGSEATHFAVAYADNKKYSLAHQSILPELAIVDPRLSRSLPASVTASSGLDALCQSIESMWAVEADPQSLKYATEGAELAVANIETAVNAPSPESRHAMALAAYRSGQAINRTRTTAPHALSYAMTIHFKVPHGFAVALSIAEFLRFNSQVDNSSCRDPRGAAAVRQRIDCINNILGGNTVDQACNSIQQLMAKTGAPMRLSQVGIMRDDFSMLVNEINVQRLANNPRSIDQAQLIALLEQIA